MLTLKITLEFIHRVLGMPTWSDILFGLEKHLLDPAAVSQVADLGLADPDAPAELIWFLEHREELADPLEAVETVYAEFGYPEAMAGFVRYMPSEDADTGDQASNERRLIERWECFVRQEQKRLAQTRHF